MSTVENIFEAASRPTPNPKIRVCVPSKLEKLRQNAPDIETSARLAAIEEPARTVDKKTRVGVSRGPAGRRRGRVCHTRSRPHRGPPSAGPRAGRPLSLRLLRGISREYYDHLVGYSMDPPSDQLVDTKRKTCCLFTSSSGCSGMRVGEGTGRAHVSASFPLNERA